jgi:ABC transporter substrate binding protein
VYRFADGYIERLPGFAEELVQLHPNVILAPASGPAVAAKKVSSTIPIVTAALADGVHLGLIASEAHPGGNVTGIAARPCRRRHRMKRSGRQRASSPASRAKSCPNTCPRSDRKPRACPPRRSGLVQLARDWRVRGTIGKSKACPKGSLLSWKCHHSRA